MDTRGLPRRARSRPRPGWGRGGWQKLRGADFGLSRCRVFRSWCLALTFASLGRQVWDIHPEGLVRSGSQRRLPGDEMGPQRNPPPLSWPEQSG